MGSRSKTPSKTIFTFDCNPGDPIRNMLRTSTSVGCTPVKTTSGSMMLIWVSETHIAIDSGLAWPGSTFVSTDSHANIMGSIGSFGQGMGDQDIAAAWAKGYVWFKVPASIRLNLNGIKPANVSAKDIVLNLLSIFGANKLLGYSVEIYGEAVDNLSLSERITISSMATEMGAIILFFTPTPAVLNELNSLTGKNMKL